MVPALVALLLFMLVALAASCGWLILRLHKAEEDATWNELEARHLAAELTRLRITYYGVDRTPRGAA